MNDYDELRAYVATEYARHGSGLMEMILARLDADADTIAKLTAERDAETARGRRPRPTRTGTPTCAPRRGCCEVR